MVTYYLGTLEAKAGEMRAQAGLYIETLFKKEGGKELGAGAGERAQLVEYLASMLKL